MDIRPIERVKLSEQVFIRLKQKILEQQWAQSEKLPSENELADMFQVSRITIRHAIHMLVMLGLVETKPGEGTFIKSPNPGMLMQSIIPAAYFAPRDTTEVLDFRYVLEIETTGMAVERCTPEDVAMLRERLQDMLDSKEVPSLFADADLAFHTAIAHITRNSLIIETYRILNDILRVCMYQTVDSLGVEIGIPYHTELIRAFEAKNVKNAKEIIRAHMDSTRGEYKRKLGEKKCPA